MGIRDTSQAAESGTPSTRLLSLLRRPAFRTPTAVQQLEPAGALAFSFKQNPISLEPSFLESVQTNFRLNSVTGASVDFLSALLVPPSDTASLVDPDFDPYKLLNQDFDSRFPFMRDDFISGRVLDFPNEQSFWDFVTTKERDFERRQAMSQNGFIKNFVTSMPGQLLDIATGGALLKTFGVANQFKNFTLAVRNGNVVSRAGKTALMSGALNTIQEEMLHALNTDRNVDRVQADLWAFGMGAAFGAGFSTLRSVKENINTGQFNRLRDDVILAQKDPGIEEASKLARGEADRLNEILASSDPPPSISPIVTPTTKPIIDKIRKKFGDDVAISEHPLQESVDTATLLSKMESELTRLAPAGAGPISGRFADIMSAVAPGAKLRKSPSSLMRRFHRIMFDDTTSTRASVDNPVTNEVIPPAESIKWNYDAWRDIALITIDEAYDSALKRGGVRQRLSNGDEIHLRSRMPGQRREYRKAVVDYMRQADKARRTNQPLPDADVAIKDAAEAVRTYTQRMGNEAISVRFLDAELHGTQFWLPRRWKAQEIRVRQADFKLRLVRQFRDNQLIDFNTGKILNENNRSLIAAAIDNSKGLKALTKEDIAKLKELAGDKSLDEIIESKVRKQLGPEVLTRYNQELDLYFDGAADSTIKSLTNVKNAHGVQHTVTGAFARRQLEIDETAFDDFLVGDIDKLLEGYHRQTSGRIASRYALSRDSESLQAIKDLTGKDPAEHAFDPALMVEAINTQFNELFKIAEQTGDPKLLKSLNRGRSHIGKVLAPKLAELEGRPFLEGNPAGQAGWAQLAGRLALRFPATAYLGKVTVSNISDLSSIVLLGGLRPTMVAKTVRALNLFKEVPRRQLEALHVAISDHVNTSRVSNTFDLDDIASGAEFGTSGQGQFMTAIDRGSQVATSTFFRLTGINRWNTNMKRTMARVVMSDMVIGAKKMAKANDLIEGGVKESIALRQAGLTAQDAAQFNRLGLNGPRSKRLIPLLREHAVDWEGNQPWKQAKDVDKAFDDFKADLGPEFNKWFDQDRELFDVFTTATNRMVLDIITEPKIMSKPVINGTLFGRIFNQFNSFAFAWGNQTAQLAARRPAYEQVQAFIIAVGFAGLADAIHNQLSGRRSFNKSADLWVNKPRAAIYGAFNRSPLMGWLARPIGLTEQTPWGFGKLLGNTELSGTFSRPIEPTGVLAGPAGSWLDQTVISIMQSAYQGKVGEKQQRQLWNAVPYHNLWFIEGALRLSENAGIDTPKFVKPRPK